MKEQINAPEIELRDEEIANLSDAQFKILIIGMVTEMAEYGHKIEEKVKAMQSEIKKNIQRTNNKGKETGTQINDLDRKEEINIQPQQKEGRIQKNEERLRNLQDFKCSNLQVIRVPEGEEEEPEIEKLFEKIMKENFSNLAKEIDFQEVQEAQRIPKKLDPRRNTPRHIIIILAKIKDKERILKAAREKEKLPTKELP